MGTNSTIPHRLRIRVPHIRPLFGNIRPQRCLHRYVNHIPAPHHGLRSSTESCQPLCIPLYSRDLCSNTTYLCRRNGLGFMETPAEDIGILNLCDSGFHGTDDRAGHWQLYTEHLRVALVGVDHAYHWWDSIGTCCSVPEGNAPGSITPMEGSGPAQTNREPELQRANGAAFPQPATTIDHRDLSSFRVGIDRANRDFHVPLSNGRLHHSFFSLLGRISVHFKDIYHFSEGQTNLVWIAMVVGTVSTAIQIPVIWTWTKREYKQAGYIRPEQRLWFAMLGGAIYTPISLFWLEWTSSVSVQPAFHPT